MMCDLTVSQQTQHLVYGYIREYQDHALHIPQDIIQICTTFYGFLFQFKSRILVDMEEKQQLTNLLSTKMNIGNFQGSKLLYSTISDERSSKGFYSKCQDVAPTIILISNDKGYTFGGFTTIPWSFRENGERYETDENAFLFFLKCDDTAKSPKTFAPVKSSQAVYHAEIGTDCVGYPDFGPWFGDEDLIIWARADCFKCKQTSYPCDSLELCGYHSGTYCRDFEYEVLHLVNDKQFIIDENTKNKEVDCVITSVEIEQLLIAKGIGDLSKYPNDSCARGDDDVREWIGDCGSDIIADSKGSHGYLENVFMVCGKQLFGIDLELSDLKYKKLRNEDIEELTLCLSEQQMRKLPFRLKDESMIKTGKVLRFLRCYGFRNIQNVVRKIERHKSKYHYIEIMACPFGCLNGGGQIRIGLSDIEAKKIAKQREHIADMRQMLHQIKNINPSVEKVSDVLYKKIMKCNVGENALFKMKLNHVSDDKSKLNINW
eukprot:828557_1